MNNKLSDDFHDIAANLHAAQCRIDELVNEISGLRARLAEYEQAGREPAREPVAMPDDEDLQFEIEWMEKAEVSDVSEYLQLIRWLKELQRRRAAMLEGGKE
ncbi:hypothetical protein [Sodalis praecaptivus]|uniref:hypothetical protein n=1 Tax=Sodalis TaxID=84565 RepID=UPI00046D60D6|nr:hypothetical protein [Sodalis praecaptivus]